jgi:hypothetical protein
MKAEVERDGESNESGVFVRGREEVERDREIDESGMFVRGCE